MSVQVQLESPTSPLLLYNDTFTTSAPTVTTIMCTTQYDVSSEHGTFQVTLEMDSVALTTIAQTTEAGSYERASSVQWVTDLPAGDHKLELFIIGEVRVLDSRLHSYGQIWDQSCTVMSILV
eukprot:TRINITY_DN28217_c0_g1_i1.p1 TRINITY_DN28217_c0_g1~~TRINITY_DN28217_c0_g1_i1.p1  ORF type:complete len:139 (+),score=11.71 TRINITY_DN28217_c0_g1_i1:53-418(+)